MKKVFLIKDAKTGLFWYGLYSNKNWTDDISEAQVFDTKGELKNCLKSGKLENMYLVIIKGYIT